MNKNAIKKYAVWARRELIARVTQKAQQFGVEKDKIVDGNADSIGEHLFTPSEKKQRAALIAKVHKDGFEQTMEAAAYTWFNRFCALRFMEVNKYLPSRVRVFTDAENNFKPQIIDEALELDIDGLNIDVVIELKETDKEEELYKYLLITQCNALGKILPGMFQKIDDWTELLFPDYILREGSVLHALITEIPEEDWNISTLDENGEPQGQVQIIGWLYQYYNTEPKDKVFEGLKKNIKITKDKIPAATQLFTPDWIVRYMVENSLGRLWLERCKAESSVSEEYMNASYFGWKYYLEEAEQEPEVTAQLEEIRKEYAKLTPEQIKCIDPCAGSGHILVYMFDVLMQIYTSYGYNARDAVRSIIENNLYGLDIDDRAAQLAYFAVMMRAAQYDRRFLTRKDEDGDPDVPQPHVYSTSCFTEGEEYGSLLITEDPGEMPGQDGQITLFDNEWHVRKILSQKYSVVCTNPPYMGISNAGAKMQEYVKKNYPDSKADLFAVLIERCGQMVKQNGYQAMITQHAWMFLSSFEKLREKLQLIDTVNMAHLGARAFDEIGGEVVQTTSFVLRKSRLKDYCGTYCRLIEPTTQQGKEDMFLAGENRHTTKQDNFSKIPGSPVAYWVSEAIYNVYVNYPSLGSIAAPRKGNSTSDNSKFLRLWHEIDRNKMNLGALEIIREETFQKRWYPYNKGGGYRKWYGFNEYLVDWYDDAAAIRAIKTAVIANYQYFMKPGLTWSTLASDNFSIRWFDEGFIFDNGGCCIFELGSKRKYICALLNSSVFKYIFGQLNPTLNFQSGEVAKFPIVYIERPEIDNLSYNCVQLSKKEYDCFETSWDFKMHPIVQAHYENADMVAKGILKGRYPNQIQDCYIQWATDCNLRFEKLKSNEEELNRIFIDIYGLQDELTPEVEDKDVTVRRADLQRDIKSLISYAVGCMFGRYSLDEPGLILAGQPYSDKFVYASVSATGTTVTGRTPLSTVRGECYLRKSDDTLQLCSFSPDPDNIIPICDDDYFNDDITGRFVQFIETVYGKDTLEDNLKYIADALGGKGTPREVIRSYFLNDFYADHVKIYQKRPIYWLFDSGKKNGFKALIYMHRYAPDTIARMRTDYVHEQQARYRTAIDGLEQRIGNSSGSEAIRLNKQLTKLKDQATEIRLYEEKIHHLADQMIRIDLDDGVKHNYEIFKDVLAKLK